MSYSVMVSVWGTLSSIRRVSARDPLGETSKFTDNSRLTTPKIDKIKSRLFKFFLHHRHITWADIGLKSLEHAALRGWNMTSVAVQKWNAVESPFHSNIQVFNTGEKRTSRPNIQLLSNLWKQHKFVSLDVQVDEQIPIVKEYDAQISILRRMSTFTGGS